MRGLESQNSNQRDKIKDFNQPKRSFFRKRSFFETNEVSLEKRLSVNALGNAEAEFIPVKAIH